MPIRLHELVTLLYLDVVSSTAMTQHLEIEDTLEILDNTFPRLAAPIESPGGHITLDMRGRFKALSRIMMRRRNISFEIPVMAWKSQDHRQH
jgi:class 3 adenylate cyclase